MGGIFVGGIFVGGIFLEPSKCIVVIFMNVFLTTIKFPNEIAFTM